MEVDACYYKISTFTTLLSVEMRVKQHSLGPNTGYL